MAVHWRCIGRSVRTLDSTPVTVGIWKNTTAQNVVRWNVVRWNVIRGGSGGGGGDARYHVEAPTRYHSSREQFFS